jgi:hypothetical protein
MLTETSAIGWHTPTALPVTGPDGVTTLSARAVLLATGCRERPRAARLVPGSRPAGVFSTGSLQQMVYLQKQCAGRRAVVVGAEHVSFSAVHTLTGRGTEVAAMLTELSEHQSYGVFRLFTATVRRVPVLTGTRVSAIAGKHRVEVKVSGYRPYSTDGMFASDQKARLAIGKLRRDDRRRTMIAGAATGVALLGGVGMSFLALGKESDSEARARLAGVTPDDPELSSMRSSGKRFSLFADIGFGLAIAGIGVTTYLFTHEGRGESEGSLRIGVGPGGATASIKF